MGVSRRARLLLAPVMSVRSFGCRKRLGSRCFPSCTLCGFPLPYSSTQYRLPAEECTICSYSENPTAVASRQCFRLLSDTLEYNGPLHSVERTFASVVLPGPRVSAAPTFSHENSSKPAHGRKPRHATIHSPEIIDSTLHLLALQLVLHAYVPLRSSL